MNTKICAIDATWRSKNLLQDVQKMGKKHTLAASEHSSTTFMELEQISTAFMEERGSLKEGCWPKNLVLRWWRQVAAEKDALNKDEDEECYVLSLVRHALNLVLCFKIWNLGRED